MISEPSAPTVIYQCALTRDLDLFETGDATEVGEKGLTLSGGQKVGSVLSHRKVPDTEHCRLESHSLVPFIPQQTLCF